MSGVFCVLIFALLFAIVVVNTTSTGAKQENRENVISKSADPPISCDLFTTNTSSVGYMCDVLCTRTRPENLIKEMEEAIDNDNSGCASIGYHLRYDEPQVSKISRGWFETKAFIKKITIKDVGGTRALITEIEPGAFNDCTFRRMTELVIRRTQVTVLKREVFEGANNLKKLTLEENGAIESIEEFTLDPLYQLEEIRMTQQPKFENLFNLTGATQLKNLRTLTVSFNNLSSSINAETFKDCTRIEILDLSNSSIDAIGIGTFDQMIETIRFLDLSYNKLKRLPSQLLEILVRPNMQIYLSNNLWICDCDSVDLQLWSINRSGLIIDSLLCDMPPLEKGNVLCDVDLSTCDPNFTSSTQTTDFTGTSDRSTTLQTPLLENLNCMNEKYESGSLNLEKVYQYFSVKQVEMGKVSVEISSPDYTLSMVVTNDKDESLCRYDINRQMNFSNLDPNSAHLFCLIKKTSHSTSPRNCYPFHFDDTKSIWGHDEIIIALVCSIVLSLVVGILCGWLLSCRYQRVFRAKESLQYQSSASSISKTVTEIEDFHSSVTSEYFAGRYGSDGGPNVKRLRRTHSDNSIVSCKSYITAVTPSPFEIIHWKLRKNAVNPNDYQVRDYLDKLEYDCLPPPLPPHPNRRNSDRIYETIGEPVYICTNEIEPYKITYASSQS